MSTGLVTVTVAETGEGAYTQKIENGRHTITADEPLDMGGLDKGPSPFELLLAALGACTTMTLRMYADRKGWPLARVSVRLSHHKEDDMGNTVVDIITRDITIEGDLDAEQRQRLLEIANKCPVHRTLENTPKLLTRLDN